MSEGLIPNSLTLKTQQEKDREKKNKTPEEEKTGEDHVMFDSTSINVRGDGTQSSPGTTDVKLIIQGMNCN